LAGTSKRRLDGGCCIATHIHGFRACAQPAGDGPGQTLRIGRQRGIERTVIGGLVTDDVDDAAASSAGVVQVPQTVGQAGSAVQQGAGRLAGDAVVAVGHASDDVLLQPENAAHTCALVQRRDEVHLARSRIREASVDPGTQERFNQTPRAVHLVSFPSSTPARIVGRSASSVKRGARWLGLAAAKHDLRHGARAYVVASTC